ncbi:hypothetical protein N0V84_010678 [Fusarium piperis]|uniref:Uncharacterized protein n=1 Tax=Fusarium piperis TaxID=1435070 RepID=A0A9W8W4G9_9HYPO|nr:hypothetical protein N0V84_010678 [Fusarium piperis]
MKSYFATGLMLSSLVAGTAHGRDMSVPECATACSRGLFRYRVANQHNLHLKAACKDMARQRELFLCLASACGEDYGPALAYTISACSNYGALIVNLLPDELDHVGLAPRGFPSLAPRFDMGRFAFDSQFTLAVDCTAGSNGVLTLSLPESVPSGIPQPPPSGDSPLLPGSGAGDPNLGSSPPAGNIDPNLDPSPPAGNTGPNLDHSPPAGNTDSNLGSQPGDPSIPNSDQSGTFANTASNGSGGDGDPSNGIGSPAPADADCNPETGGSRSNPSGTPNGQAPSQHSPGSSPNDAAAGPGSGASGNSSPQSPDGSQGNPVDCAVGTDDPACNSKTQENALGELMARLTVPHQVLQRLQHRKNQYQHLVLPFLCQPKVTPTVLQMDLPCAPSPVSLKQHQHHLCFPTPTPHLMVATPQETQEAPKPAPLQPMEVIKRVRHPTQVAVAVLLKLRLALHRLLRLPASQATALRVQGILPALYPAKTDLTQGLVALLLSRHPQVLSQPATLLQLQQMLDCHLRKEKQILRPMEMAPLVMEVLAHALVAHQTQKTVLSLMVRYLQVLMVMAVRDLIRHEETVAVVTVCLHATATARQALVVVSHLSLGLQILLSSLLAHTTANSPVVQVTAAKDRMTGVPKRLEIMKHQDNPLL